MLRLRRFPGNPILEANPRHQWEERAVFNAAAVRKNGTICLIYRAVNEDYVSSLGLAVSRDGLRFHRLAKPVYVGQDPSESRGVEDPRITFIDGKYRMLYTAYDGRYPRVALAESPDLLRWQRVGIVLPHLHNKDSAIFPERIGGRYCMVHRDLPNMWLAWSDDLRNWGEFEVIATPRPRSWEEEKIGLSGPPTRIPEGWLLLYHGVDRHKVYRQGAMLLDPGNPRRVIRRTTEPILEPETDYELHGDVPNVVFSCGHVVLGDTLLFYYAGADTVICLATCPMAEIRAWAQGRL